MIKKNYKSLNKDELLKVIEKLESKKEYGLVWDEERVPEKVVLECQENLPVLTEIKDKEIITNEEAPTHILIEGDNYHALSVLNYTHRKSVDLIYIDPPYNKGDKDFIYNDNYVDKEDGYRHSKWLTFIKKRLVQAKDILKEDGTIFISIDDVEYARLILLTEKLFGEKNIKTVCVKVAEPTGVKMAQVIKSGGIPKLKEYLVIARKNGIRNFDIERVKKESWDSEYNLFLEGVEKSDILQLKEIIENKDRENADILLADSICGEFKTVSVESKLRELNIDEDMQEDWKFSNAWRIIRTCATSAAAKKAADSKRKNTTNDFFAIITPRKEMYIIRNHYNKASSQPRIKILFADDYLTIHPGDFWQDIKTTGLGDEGGVEFLNGKKPLALIKRVIRSINNPNAVVCDFFAGSGTTGQAVIELNEVDEGKRQFILVTNNESNICDEKTYPRIKNTIFGYSNYEGKGGNLKYFKTSFVKNNRNKDQLKIDITKRCTEMLCLKEDVYKLRKEYEHGGEAVWKIFEHGKRYMAVYYDFAGEPLNDLRGEMNKLKGEKVLYCFTVDPHGLDINNFSDWKDIRFESIPQKILDVYKRIFKD